ncbi:MAG: universal stress protein [Pseudomonadota bacterium]
MYKSILVHVDHTEKSLHRIEVAARLAHAYDAHLVGAALTGLPSFMFPGGSIDGPTPPIALAIEAFRAEANLALDLFDKTAGGLGVNSCERRLVDDEAGLGMCLHARYSDLVIISQSTPGEFLPRLRADFPGYVLLNSLRPVLVLPYAGAGGDIGRCVTVAWNGEAQALRAITSAIPMLKRAGRVDLVVFNDARDEDVHGQVPGADMALYLARHGVTVDVTAVAGAPDGQSLLSFAADKGADLIVMGAYGHSRFHEFVLGGMTRTALASSPVPLWLSH